MLQNHQTAKSTAFIEMVPQANQSNASSAPGGYLCFISVEEQTDGGASHSASAFGLSFCLINNDRV